MQAVGDVFQTLPHAADDGEPPFAALARRPASASLTAGPGTAAGGVAVARLEGFDVRDQPRVAGVTGLPGRVLTARTTVPLRAAMIGAQVVVVFEGGDPECPIVLGVLRQPVAALASPAAVVPEPVAGMPCVQAQVDGDRLVLTAEREVVLQCGEASITLTRAGKVLIQGAYVSSRSRGYNKIKGAAIDIN